MYTPAGGRAKQAQRSSAADAEGRALEYVVCGLVGLAATLVFFWLFYSLLVVGTRGLYLLSSTAIAFALVSMWLLVWIAAEVLWEWRAGRFTADR